MGPPIPSRPSQFEKKLHGFQVAHPLDGFSGTVSPGQEAVSPYGVVPSRFEVRFSDEVPSMNRVAFDKKYKFPP